MMTAVAAASGGLELRQVVARIERLPYCSWHRNMRLIIMSAWFFDAFDSITIAYVLPSIGPLWHINPQMVGNLIGIGFAGQLIGSIAAGWVAEYWGRVRTMMLTLLVFALASLVCAFAWSYESMYVIRFVQGIGLGGEVPLMAAYVNEFAKAERRGRFSISVQWFFSLGLVGAALLALWVVPVLGWRWMFGIGAVPALIVFPLRAMLPESPRWLASRGRFADADAALQQIETVAARERGSLPALPADLPLVSEAKPRIADLFKGIYARRTLAVWGIWICTYFITYGLTAWAPQLFVFVYHVDPQTARIYGFILQAVGLIGVLSAIFGLDHWGRKPMFTAGLGIGCLPLLAFLFLGQVSAETVLIMVCASFLFISILAVSLATYTAEIYPTQLRALGGGVAGAWQRGASMVGPIMVGFILPHGGLNRVFVVFGFFAAVGALITAFFATETRQRVLERLSPA
jgi:MFS transporter, putative metabolite:H+ symporter